MGVEMASKRKAKPDRWDDGRLGRDERFVGVAPAAEELRVDTALGLQMISIRLPARLLEQLKVIAGHNGIGYQPLIRDVLSRFAHGELIQVLRQQTEIAELEGRKAAAPMTKIARTNPFMRDPAVRERTLLKSVASSSAIEGIRAPFRKTAPKGKSPATALTKNKR